MNILFNDKEMDPINFKLIDKQNTKTYNESIKPGAKLIEKERVESGTVSFSLSLYIYIYIEICVLLHS